MDTTTYIVATAIIALAAMSFIILGPPPDWIRKLAQRLKRAK